MFALFELAVILALLLIIYKQTGHSISLAALNVKIEALALKIEKLVNK